MVPEGWKKTTLGEISTKVGDGIHATPKYAEQVAIGDLLWSRDQEIELLKKDLAALRNQKSALMQQLLTGKRRVKIEEIAA